MTLTRDSVSYMSLHLSSLTLRNLRFPLWHEVDWFMPRRLQCSAEVERTRGVQTNSRTIVAAQRYVHKYAHSLWIRAALFFPQLWDCLWGSLMCSCFQSHPPGLHRTPLCTLNCTSLHIPLFSLEDKRYTILPGDARQQLSLADSKYDSHKLHSAKWLSLSWTSACCWVLWGTSLAC